MATTPRAYLWKEAQLINNTAESTGATFHFYDTQAEAIYLHNGLQYKSGTVLNGHWEDLEWSSEKELEDKNYEFLKSDHPATGSLYMVALQHKNDDDILWLFRYDYMRDISELIENCTLTLQVDNPISQISASVKNVKDALFTSEASLFAPSSKLTLGVAFGKGPISTMAIGYVDEVDWKYGAKTVSISGRNSVGFYLNDQSYDADEEYNGTAVAVFTQIFQKFGITNFVIDPLGANITVKLSVQAKDTALKTIQNINAICTDTTTEGKMWDIEEMYDGTVVVGFDEFRGQYMPRSTYTFDGKNDVFALSINRAIDGVYAKVRCVGTDSNRKDLTPVVKTVDSWKYWRVGTYKVYHAQKLEGTTQADLEKYAKALAKQLKYIGRVIKYKSPLRPQLLIGDIAEVTNGVEAGEEVKNPSTITEIKHTFGQKGYFTEFTLDSGGNPHKLENGRVYSTGKSVGGSNRTKRITDFINTKADETSAGGTPPGPKPYYKNYSYAEFDGSGYIALPFYVHADNRIIIDFQIYDTGDMAVFGNSIGGMYQHLGRYNGAYTTSTGSAQVTFNGDDTRHEFISNITNTNKLDNNPVSSYTPTTPGAKLWLGGCQGKNNYEGRLYRFRIVDGQSGSLLMDLTPKRFCEADGATIDYGLYDSVAGLFYRCNGMTLWP